MTIKIIACEVMKEELLAVSRMFPLPGKVEFQFVSMGLHLHPPKLHVKLQELLDQTPGYSRIILGFGLCGGAANRLKAPDCILTIPRVHDCIPVLLGSLAMDRRLIHQNVGTFFLSGGWMEGERTVLYEHQRICDRYGPEKALDILNRMFENYTRITYIKTDHPRHETGVAESRKLAHLLNLNLEISEGTGQYLQKLVSGPWDEQDFINVNPGETIDEAYFN